MTGLIASSSLLSSPSNTKSISGSKSFSFLSTLKPFRYYPFQSLSPNRISSPSVQIRSGIRELRERIDTVKNTQKITEAMRLVAAARVRRAQDAVIKSRPFTETLVEVLYSINQSAQLEDIDFPLSTVRPVKRVALVVITGDKGLCGGFNNALIKKANLRVQELKQRGIECVVISVGKKGNAYFSRTDEIEVDKCIEGVFPTTKEAQVIADDVFSLFVSEEVDKVELIYTNFVYLIKSDPVIHTLFLIVLFLFMLLLMLFWHIISVNLQLK